MTYPTHQEFIDQCAAGLLEQRRRKLRITPQVQVGLRAVQIVGSLSQNVANGPRAASSYLNRPHVTEAEALARRQGQCATKQPIYRARLWAFGHVNELMAARAEGRE
jgi:hypothetical protein